MSVCSTHILHNWIYYYVNVCTMLLYSIGSFSIAFQCVSVILNFIICYIMSFNKLLIGFMCLILSKYWKSHVDTLLVVEQQPALLQLQREAVTSVPLGVKQRPTILQGFKLQRDRLHRRPAGTSAAPEDQTAAAIEAGHVRRYGTKAYRRRSIRTQTKALLIKLYKCVWSFYLLITFALKMRKVMFWSPCIWMRACVLFA